MSNFNSSKQAMSTLLASFSVNSFVCLELSFVNLMVANVSQGVKLTCKLVYKDVQCINMYKNPLKMVKGIYKTPI